MRSCTDYYRTVTDYLNFYELCRGPPGGDVGMLGTGGGFKKFSGGETDISDASRLILKPEMKSCKQAVHPDAAITTNEPG